MSRGNYNDLLAFLAVARERSFTRAAAQLGVSQSALSHTIRALEKRLGLRLLTRTTRNVSATEAGERLAANSGRFSRTSMPHSPRWRTARQAERHDPLTSSEHAAETILCPVLEKFLPQYPEIHVEIITDMRFTDIVAERFDAGVRLGESLAKDMVAVPIGPPTMRLSWSAHPPISIRGRRP